MFYGHCKLRSPICADEKQEWWNRAEFCQNSFPGGSVVKNLPTKQEMQVSCLGWKDCLEEGMANHSNILAWEIPMDRGAWRAIVHGVTKNWI